MSRHAYRGIIVAALAVVSLLGVGMNATAATVGARPQATAASALSVGPSAKSALCGFTNAQPVLSEGSTGTAVKQAQCELNEGFAFGSATNFGKGPHGGVAVDGDFGANTLAATKAFQRKVHLSVDGVIGPDTWSELNRCVNMATFC
jgi:peptidoglycan hydrolase-like protein with peptidoglycan-binding domain